MAKDVLYIFIERLIKRFSIDMQEFKFVEKADMLMKRKKKNQLTTTHLLS